MTKPFVKTYLTPQGQISLLKNRGLEIHNERKACAYLSTIGYFRLSAYFYPLLETPKHEHRFKPEATFQKALDMYRFDRKLRIILLNEIEKIEIAVRARIANCVAESTGDVFWMTNPVFFANQNRFETALASIDSELSKSKEDFILHFKQTYREKYPQAWMMAEILPMGTLTHIYSNLKDNALRKKVAKEFGLSHRVLESWLIVLYGLRNMCCHHSRTWNRELAIVTMNPRKPKYKWIITEATDKRRMYYRICMIRYLLFSVAPKNSLKERITNLFKEFPTIDAKAMDFPIGWEDDVFWKP